jgi:hypothetical protein
MSRTKRNQKATMAATRLWQRARQTAEDAKPVAARVKPLASDAKDAASRGLRKARAWAAPQVDRTGQKLQDTVAPKVAAALRSSAQRLDPGKPPRRGWRKAAAGIPILLAAVASAIAAVARNRKAHSATPGEEATPATGDAKASGNAEVKNPARTS